MAFPDGFVEEVRHAADIVRVISEHVPLKKMGTSWKGLCPFHQEKTPSFNVRSEPAVFHCFGCGEGGDVFKFVMLHERVAFPEAIETLARRFGVAIPENQGRSEVGVDRKEREEILALMEMATQHFERTLWTAPGKTAREYLLGRGFKKETLEKVRAGAARDSWDDLLGALRGQFAPRALLAAGLVLERQGKDGHYDRFRNRAVFPILGESGKVVAFGARSLDGSEPKYLNSPETAVYQKGRVLYGLSWAKDAIRREGRIVLMEGYLDVARALEAGVEEVVATCGTALTAGHGRLLHRFAERVVLNFDQDDAGQKAARKSFDVLLDEGVRVQVVELPTGHDPDTYLKAEGADAYRSRLGEAPEAMEWLIRRAAEEHRPTTPAGKAAFLSALLPTLTRIESAVERSAWIPRIVERGGLDEQATHQELRRAMKTRGPIVVREIAEAAIRQAPRATLLLAEKHLLALLAQGGKNVDEALGELTEDDIAPLRSADLLRAAKGLYLRAERVDVDALRAAVADEDSRRLLNEVVVGAPPPEVMNALHCVRELRLQPKEARLREIQKKLNAGTTDDALLLEKNRLAQEIRHLASL